MSEVGSSVRVGFNFSHRRHESLDDLVVRLPATSFLHDEFDLHESIQIAAECSRTRLRIKSGEVGRETLQLVCRNHFVRWHCQYERELAIATWTGRELSHCLVHIVDPRHVELLDANLTDLISNPINQALHCVCQKLRRLRCPAGFAQLSVVLITSQVVMVGEEMSGRKRHHATSCEDQELKQSRSSTVAIAERVNPSNVEMRVDCARWRQSELDLWIVGSEDIAFQPIAELLHEVLAVFCWSTAVVQNADRIVTNLTRNHVWFVLGPVEDLEVVVTGELRVIRELLLA